MLKMTTAVLCLVLLLCAAFVRSDDQPLGVKIFDESTNQIASNRANVINGTTHRFLCEVQQIVQIHWLLGNVTLDDTGTGHVSGFGGRTTSRVAVIIKWDLHGLNLTCWAFVNWSNTASVASVKLNVIVSPKTILISDQLSMMTVKYGQWYQFSCRVPSSNPGVEIVWYLEGQWLGLRPANRTEHIVRSDGLTTSISRVAVNLTRPIMSDQLLCCFTTYTRYFEVLKTCLYLNFQDPKVSTVEVPLSKPFSTTRPLLSNRTATDSSQVSVTSLTTQQNVHQSSTGDFDWTSSSHVTPTSPSPTDQSEASSPSLVTGTSTPYVTPNANQSSVTNATAKIGQDITHVSNEVTFLEVLTTQATKYSGDSGPNVAGPTRNDALYTGLIIAGALATASGALVVFLIIRKRINRSRNVVNPDIREDENFQL